MTVRPLFFGFTMAIVSTVLLVFSGWMSSIHAQSFTLDQIKASYLQCVQQAVDRSESALLETNRRYHQEQERFLQERAAARHQVWTITDDRQRRNAERDTERTFRTRERDLTRALRDEVDGIEDRFRDEKRTCNKTRRDQERQLRIDQNNADASPFPTNPSRASAEQNTTVTSERFGGVESGTWYNTNVQ